jgi:hypothetical protein
MPDKASRHNLSPRRRKAADPAGAPTRNRNRVAIERTIAALRRADRILELDAGSLAIVRTTAQALDAAEGSYDLAIVARVHIAALGSLLAGHQAPADDELDRFLASLRAPEVRNPQDA